MTDKEAKEAAEEVAGLRKDVRRQGRWGVLRIGSLRPDGPRLPRTSDRRGRAR